MSSHTLAISRRLFCGLAAASLVVMPSNAADDNKAAQIMRASYQTTRFDQVRFTATLSLRSGARTQQQRSLSGVAKLMANAQARLIRFSSPADMAGVATLTVERGGQSDDLWVYLPAMHRVRRLVTGNRADPWVGSDFSFGDIVGHKVGDWRHRLDETVKMDGADVYVITSTPGNAAVGRDTGYGMRRSWVRASDNALLRCDFYTLAGELLKSAAFSQFRSFPGEGGKAQPMVMAMHNSKRNTTSVLRFDRFAIDQAVAPREVAPEALTR